MAKVTLVVLLTISCVVLCKPLDKFIDKDANMIDDVPHSVQKRFVNPFLPSGGFEENLFGKMRTKRSLEECEKLQLCKLHARSRHSFLASFQLYFVNKENARLWDHRARSAAECEQRYSCYER